MAGRDDFKLPFVFIPDEAVADSGSPLVARPVRLRARLTRPAGQPPHHTARRHDVHARHGSGNEQTGPLDRRDKITPENLPALKVPAPPAPPPGFAEGQTIHRPGDLPSTDPKQNPADNMWMPHIPSPTIDPSIEKAAPNVDLPPSKERGA